MRSIQRWVGLGSGALLFAVLVQGCGGSSTDSSVVPFDQLPDQFASAICDNIGGCCQAASISFDLATCKANAKAFIQQGLVAQVNANALRYDANAAEACLTAFADEVKSCRDDHHASDEVCNRAFAGAVPIGGACTTGNECAAPPVGSAQCAFDSTVTQGKCELSSVATPGAHGKLGQACIGSCDAGGDCSGGFAGSGETVSAICYVDDGLYCAGSICQPLNDLGKPCAAFEGCVAGAYCGDANTCVAQKPDGAKCALRGECASGRCKQPADGTTGVCSVDAIASTSTCSGTFK